MADMPVLPPFPDAIGPSLQSPANRLKVGMDLVQISRIQSSIEQFGERFMKRVFTDHEADYAASAPALRAERLAARFAAKEATMKALGLTDKGVAWRDMEVQRLADGHCELRLHGVAAQHAAASGVVQTALTLSHDGDYAAAVVAAVIAPVIPSAIAPVIAAP